MRYIRFVIRRVVMLIALMLLNRYG